MMNRKEAVDYIENRTWQGSSLDLDRMKKLMKLLGNPQDRLHFVHVAGTNGKGSACAMMTSILMDAGYNVGTYISPHLINYEERFSINNKNISEKEFASLTNRVKKASLKLDFEPRVFELLTAIAFLYFDKHKVDIVVLEVGMGGRLDATNIINESIVSLIMNIGLEHTEILGDTLDKIAYEKCGIIKNNGDVVFYQNNKEVMNTFKRVVKERNANAIYANFKDIKILKQENNYSTFDYGSLKNIKLSLLGKHQFNNASVVIEAIKVINKKGYRVTNKNIKNGLKKVKWDARMSILSRNPLFVLDGAHNPQCASALKESLPQVLKKKKAIFLCGMLKDKNYELVMDMMIPFAKEFICITPSSSRALSNIELAKLLNNKKQKTTCVDSVKEGIELSFEKANKNDVIITFGSLYLAGDVLNNFNDAYRNYLRKASFRNRNKMSKKLVNENSIKIINKLIKTKEYKESKNVLIYNSINNEVDLSALVNDRKKVFAYPKCLNDKMLALIPNGEMIDGKFGIREPSDTSKEMKKIDLVICPLLCFDKNLNRIGYGKGYYDHFLEKKKCKIIGVAYDNQLVNNIPVNKKDKKLDLVVTNDKIYR